MAVKSSRVNVATSATRLDQATTDLVGGSSICVTNRHASASIDLGDAAVASGSGYELVAGASVTITLDGGEVLYGIAASGTVRCDVIQAGV